MQLFYRETGQGLPLIILHGLFGSSDNWASVAKRIGEYYKVYTVDQRNHGQSPKSEEFTYAAMAEDLKTFIEENDIKDPVVLGHSMGGKTAMTFALKYPELLRKLIVVDIAPKAYPLHHETILEGLNSVKLNQVRSRKDADVALSNYISELGIRQFLLKNLYRNEEGSFDWRINLPVITEKIANVGEEMQADESFNKPTLFIRGEASNYVLDEDQENIKALFTRAQVKTIRNAGHWVHAEQPEPFVKMLLEFI